MIANQNYYDSTIKKYSVLTREDEDELCRRLPDDKKAVEILLCSNMRYVIKYANKFRNTGLELEDLIQEGLLGVLRATKTFEPARGVPFLAYAMPWIKQFILSAIQEKGKSIRIPKRKFKELEIHIASLDAMIAKGDKGETSLADFLEDDSIENNPETTTEIAEMKAKVSEATKNFSNREREILTLRFGLDGKTPLSLKKTGDIVGLSPEGVRGVEAKILQSLRENPLLDGYQVA